MNKSQLFKKAHQMAKVIVALMGGSYRVAFSGALKLVLSKKLNFRIVGDTFPMKKEFAKAGFIWNPNMKSWEAKYPTDLWAFGYIVSQMAKGKIKNIAGNGNAQAHAWMAASY